MMHIVSACCFVDLRPLTSTACSQADLNTLDVEVGGGGAGKTLLGTQPRYGMSMEVIVAS